MAPSSDPAHTGDESAHGSIDTVQRADRPDKRRAMCRQNKLVLVALENGLVDIWVPVHWYVYPARRTGHLRQMVASRRS
jgi:hypothetical protein